MSITLYSCLISIGLIEDLLRLHLMINQANISYRTVRMPTKSWTVWKGWHNIG